MKRFLNVLFWSVIAAAFIGPGTVTTAASSGARFGYTLLWALLFSTLATLVLQEASARVAVISGYSLGEAIRKQFYGGARGILTLLLVLGAIVFGCAAYEAGNILGGVAGVLMGTGFSATAVTLATAFVTAVMLWLGSPRAVAYLLSLVVAFMGVTFLVTAFLLRPPLMKLLSGSLVPGIPHGSGILILGLIGTTVVPYNLFLGSGLAKGQTLPELRFGLSISILLGGAISMAVLVVGAAIAENFSFEALSATLAARVGLWAATLFAFGLFAAGFSSAITAPLAAAITARGLFEKSGQNLWHDRSIRYRSVWSGVLLVGVGFGLADVRPIPAIILAQALNGIVLPFVAAFLLLVVNDRSLMGRDNRNGKISNAAMSLVVGVTVVLGVTNVLKAAASALHLPPPNEISVFSISGICAAALSVPMFRSVRSRRNRSESEPRQKELQSPDFRQEF